MARLKVLLFMLCSFTILLFNPTESRASEDFRRDSKEELLASNRVLNPDANQNTDDRWHHARHIRSDGSETETSPNEGISGQTLEPPSTEPTETTSNSTPIEEDIPVSTSSTEVMNGNTNNDVSSTTEESESEQITTTESITSSTTLDDFENTVDDAAVKSTTEATVQLEQSSTPKEGVKPESPISVNKLSDQIKFVLQQYKETGSVIIPNVKIPDPMHIPDMDKRMSMVSMDFKNQTVHGLSNFTVQHINTDLEKMQVFVMLHMKTVVILGNYSMKSFISRASGPFNVTLLDVITEGAAALHYNSNGQLEASETDMDMSFRDIKLDFKNLGIMGAFFQGVVGAVGTLIFEGIKPPILMEVNTKMKEDVNVKIRTMSSNAKANASMNPVDQAILEGRRYVKDQGYDPYVINNYTMNLAGFLKLNITEFTFRGLSRFYRVGEVSLSMDNGTVEFGLHLAADNITGTCHWSAGLARTKLRDGMSSYTIDHIQGRAIIKQSLDLNKPPQLDDIDFLIGNINLKTTREDALDVIAESVINNLPLLIRHVIVDGLEEPVKYQTQKILDQVDVRSLVDEQLPNIDKIGV